MTASALIALWLWSWERLPQFEPAQPDQARLACTTLIQHLTTALHGLADLRLALPIQVKRRFWGRCPSCLRTFRTKAQLYRFADAAVFGLYMHQEIALLGPWPEARFQRAEFELKLGQAASLTWTARLAQDSSAPSPPFHLNDLIAQHFGRRVLARCTPAEGPMFQAVAIDTSNVVQVSARCVFLRRGGRRPTDGVQCEWQRTGTAPSVEGSMLGDLAALPVLLPELFRASF